MRALEEQQILRFLLNGNASLIRARSFRPAEDKDGPKLMNRISTKTFTKSFRWTRSLGRKIVGKNDATRCKVLIVVSCFTPIFRYNKRKTTGQTTKHKTKLSTKVVVRYLIQIERKRERPINDGSHD